MCTCKVPCLLLPGWYGDLSESSEQHSRREANKGHNGSLKKVQFPHQNIRGFSALWDLLHEVHVHLVEDTQLTTAAVLIVLKAIKT